ncbi:MAG: hypothetical protein K2Q03_06990 [Sphingobacteriaceae bacterium]|nr:hypothetical protein [Sphingobacteriaceae bacterium]
MKVKITPLNIVSALAITLAIYLLYFADKSSIQSIEQPKNLIVILCFAGVVVSFIVDQMFRRMIQSLKKIWMIEIMLIALTILFTLILRFIFK